MAAWCVALEKNAYFCIRKANKIYGKFGVEEKNNRFAFLEFSR